jgi:hypothetical protein
MHLRHKWRNIFKASCVVHASVLFIDVTYDGIAGIDQCTKCGKERGWIKSLDGTREKIDPDFIRMGTNKANA